MSERTLAVLNNVTLPRMPADPPWDPEENGSGPPPNIQIFDCLPIEPGEMPYIPELNEVMHAEGSPDGTSLHGFLPVGFWVSEGGHCYLFNRFKLQDLSFPTLIVKARSV